MKEDFIDAMASYANGLKHRSFEIKGAETKALNVDAMNHCNCTAARDRIRQGAKDDSDLDARQLTMMRAVVNANAVPRSRIPNNSDESGNVGRAAD